MRKRDMPLETIRINAAAFGVTPELQWLMDGHLLWQRLVEGIRLANKGMVVGPAELPTKELREWLEVLEALRD